MNFQDTYIFRDIGQIIQHISKDHASKIHFLKSPVDSTISLSTVSGKPVSYVKLYNERNTNVTIKYKNRDIVSGLIRSLNPLIVFDGQNDIEVCKYDCIIRNQDFDFAVEVQCQQDLVLKYLTRSLSWNPTGIVNIEDETLRLHIHANIKNENQTLVGDFTLVAGNQNVTSERSNMTVKSNALMVRESMSSNISTTKGIEDYETYNLSNVKLSASISVPIDEFSTKEFKKLYLHVPDSSETSFGYIFKSPSYLPQCNVHVYKDHYLGSTEIEESRKGDDVLLILGESSIVKCKSIIERFEHENKDITVIINVEVNNRSESSHNIRIIHWVGDTKINIRPLPNDRINGKLIWDRVVNPGISNLVFDIYESHS